MSFLARCLCSASENLTRTEVLPKPHTVRSEVQIRYRKSNKSRNRIKKQWQVLIFSRVYQWLVNAGKREKSCNWIFHFIGRKSGLRADVYRKSGCLIVQGKSTHLTSTLAYNSDFLVSKNPFGIAAIL